jgi:hypothetical protein
VNWRAIATDVFNATFEAQYRVATDKPIGAEMHFYGDGAVESLKVVADNFFSYLLENKLVEATDLTEFRSLVEGRFELW